MYPQFVNEYLELEEGKVVSVEGYRAPGPRFNRNTSVAGIHVETAVIDGQEFAVEDYLAQAGYANCPRDQRARFCRRSFDYVFACAQEPPLDTNRLRRSTRGAWCACPDIE
ncbi:MAG: hypothetical protein ACLFR1_12185 [Spirochaetia bacterium]